MLSFRKFYSILILDALIYKSIDVYVNINLIYGNYKREITLPILKRIILQDYDIVYVSKRLFVILQ